MDDSNKTKSKGKSFENITVAVKKETKEIFEDLYNESGANSKGEFINMLIQQFIEPETVTEKVKVKTGFEDLYNELGISTKEEFINLLKQRLTAPEPVAEKIIEKIISEPVPIELKENEILISLNQVQLEMLKKLAEGERTVKFYNYIFNQSRNKETFKGLLLPEMLEQDSVSEKMGKILLIVSFGIMIWGPMDTLAYTFNKRGIKEMIAKHYPELEKAETE